MTYCLNVDEVRDIVLRHFILLGKKIQTQQSVNETVLIDDGRYVGRTYRTDTMMAMWMVDVGLLQFYDEAGNMLRTINLLDRIEPQRAAA